ncbi:MAG: M3 family oligoendopeptidase [Candidatus Zixiibacteriota bacterium]
MSNNISAPKWDLDSVFPGGSESKKYADFRAKIKADLEKLKSNIEKLPEKLNDSSRKDWIKYILKLQDFFTRLITAHAFIGCLVSANTDDEKAQQIQGEIDVFEAEYEKINVFLEAFAKNQSEAEWKKLVGSDELKEIQFYLNELRRTAKLKMKPEFEALAADLAVNGYHAWNRLYDKMYGNLRVQFKERGQTTELSLGQLANKMVSPIRDIRRQAFEKLEAAWERRSNEAAMALNFMAGFRLTLYSRRGWENPALEALLNSRLQEETLDAMWAAVTNSEEKIKRYIIAKKKLLSIKNFRWYDQAAPIGSSKKTYTFEEAGDFVVDNLAKFSKSQAEFTRMALDKNWVEAENRPGKRGGAFCTDFLSEKQTRVFMTYEGSFDNISTLAHELGHAYHQNVMMKLPPYATIYPMPLAETASIFNEFLVTDAALQMAESTEDKLAMLDTNLQNALGLFCDLHARFIFDMSFYAERKKGLVSRERLDELMVAAQKQGFFGTLAETGYHPLFWASKLHFFLSNQPFYNFPYTFGYLFASGVYNRAKTEGESFAPKYEALLTDTGRMFTEEVAKKHMGVDLTQPDFWNSAVERCMIDIDLYEKLADEVAK